MRALILAAALGACLIAGTGRSFADGSNDPSLIIYGNFCGPGQNGANPSPIDALDTACMHHDACVPDEGLPSCSCHARLHQEAHQVAMTPRVSDYTRNMALFIESMADMMVCRPDRVAGEP